MEEWSDSEIIKDFKVKLFLDTNILVFLVDHKFKALTYSINFLNELKFIELLSSRFVVFEFMGVRKKEHYCRLVIDQQGKSSSNIKVNYSSLIKNISSFKDHIGGDQEFEKLIKKVKVEVENELELITKDFNIEYSNNLLHDDLLAPTFDVCLSTKISKEDSLVLLTALFPSETITEEKISILTKDSGFVSGYDEKVVHPILENYDLVSPNVESIEGLKIESGININLSQDLSEKQIKDFWEKKVLEKILLNNEHLFLGKTFVPSSLPDSIICFKLKPKVELKGNVFVTIISKNLLFIYTSKHPIDAFWNNGNILKNTFVSDNPENIAFKLQVERDGKWGNISSEMTKKLRNDGNLVFLHPDN